MQEASSARRAHGCSEGITETRYVDSMLDVFTRPQYVLLRARKSFDERALAEMPFGVISP